MVRMPGSPYQQNWDERNDGPKGALLVDVLKAWAFDSSQGTTTYETVLRRDGTLTCNCPGWINKKKGEARGCKHTRDVAREAADLVFEAEGRGPALGRAERNIFRGSVATWAAEAAYCDDKKSEPERPAPAPRAPRRRAVVLLDDEEV